ncbi:MAG: tetratricopeptide repeat protein [Gemmatimonadota bacterium]|nr:tetratricopeptide repeat protein [Gemmatimonadota bacterium]
MNWLKKLIGGTDGPRGVDYYAEAMALLDAGSLHEALTSLRLALKDTPGDPLVLQQIAITYTRMGLLDEAAKTYRHVLQKHPDTPGAHYGLAFLLVRGGHLQAAAEHLRAFLAGAPSDPASAPHVTHARETLDALAAMEDEAGGAARESA